ncbi:hypothetical protein [Pelagibacterium halotolerans]|uniref:Uncharacterized protein n=1 Tax=Pelagibacterium halotolerans (strain DSM 22347 / JCM 15775 / CGMCC 1.7692 / B2) TaxID=1082931 RepID=G4R6Q7_PELHB|nr:hypothetical protein [Pelagibacterium halotolerans]AEQ52219.1 hypothetical protein KKY_2210 [Pelagibacterium halotolerans B2]QJR18028.1 hypothetical protein HKM20_05995 [Pelagibacterium halotolerans]SEA94957.1 hypothetical protein SAMN05428936_11445 [Pelagibacterium halotolerans]
MSSAVSTGFKKMNWVSKPSAWEAMETARLKRREMMEEFQASSAALVSGFQAAQTMQIQGVGELAAQGVQARMDAKVKEMQDKLEDRYASLSKLV